MAIDTAFGNSFGDLSGQIAARRQLASNNFFQTLGANRQAMGQLADARQRELNNTLALASLVSNARDNRRRQALFDTNRNEEVALALMREAGINRRAKESQLGNVLNQRQAYDISRADREEDILRRSEEMNFARALDMVRQNAVNPDEIPLPLSPESKATLNVGYKNLQRGEAEGNKLAEEVAGSLNAYLARPKKARESLMALYNDTKIGRTELKNAAKQIVAESGVKLDYFPTTRESIPLAAAQIMSQARNENMTRAGKMMGQAVTFDPEADEFHPIITSRYNRAAAPAQPGPVAPQTAAAPPIEREITPDVAMGASITSALIARGQPPAEAAQMARNIMANPALRARYAQALQSPSTNAVPAILRSGGMVSPPVQ